MAEPSAAPSCLLDVPDEDWAEAVRREEFLTISGTQRAAKRTLTQQPQRWVESHDRGTTPKVLRSCRGESHDPGKATAGIHSLREIDRGSPSRAAQDRASVWILHDHG